MLSTKKAVKTHATTGVELPCLNIFDLLAHALRPCAPCWFPPHAWVQAFEQHKLGAGSEIAATLEVDGEQNVFRGKLGDMLNDILGRPAHKVELQVSQLTERLSLS